MKVGISGLHLFETVKYIQNFFEIPRHPPDFVMSRFDMIETGFDGQLRIPAVVFQDLEDFLCFAYGTLPGNRVGGYMDNTRRQMLTGGPDDVADIGS